MRNVAKNKASVQLGKDGTMIHSKGYPLDYYWVEIKDGRIWRIGYENYREGGSFWWRIHHREATIESLKKEMPKLARQGRDFYNFILEYARKDSKSLPSYDQMRYRNKQHDVKMQETKVSMLRKQLAREERKLRNLYKG